MCDYNLKIYSVIARYPGSFHDAAVWSLSPDRKKLESNFNAGERNSWLLGDSGYPLEPWLLTPFKGTLNESQRHFNFIHAKGRNPVERCNGVLKGTFRCLLGERKLRYEPEKVVKIINVCCALHNICLYYKLSITAVDTPDYPDSVMLDEDVDVVLDTERELAVKTRDKIMHSLV